MDEHGSAAGGGTTNIIQVREEGLPAGRATQKKKQERMSQRQRVFMSKVRANIDWDTCPSFYQDWTHITPTRVLYLFIKRGATCTMASLCLKPMATWRPHKLDSSYIPICPKCGTTQYASTTKAQSQRNDPMPFFKSRNLNHGYLDTVEYPCAKCRATFLGTDLKSLSWDTSYIVLKHFSIHPTQRAAIDEHLFEYIIQAPIGQKNSKINNTSA
jgi:hypothetical protein